MSATAAPLPAPRRAGADRSALLVTPTVLRARLAADPTTLVLDASVDLPRPRVDGDHRARSGRAGWAAGHIPGALHLDLLGDFADPGSPLHFTHPAPDRAARVLAALGVTDAHSLVVYDRHDGFWAARAWWSLRALGVRARVLDGGLRAWVRDGGQVRSAPAAAADLPRAVTPARGASARTTSGTGPTLRADPSAWATRDDVLAVLAGRRDADLVCALGADQFTGTAPTRYHRRGHIPTSRNVPARSLAGDDGLLRPTAALRSVLADPLGSQDRPVIVYCGGGIAASYAALGLVLAGRTAVSVYDGSLEEWTADPSLPVAT